jgi:O-antigen/teichoic acid export membrane protein
VLVGTLIAGAGLLLINAQSSMVLPLAVELRNVRLTLVEVTKQAIGTAGIGALAIAGASLVPFFGVQVLIGIGILLLTPLLVGRGSIVAPRYDRAAWRSLIVEALPLATAFVLGHVYFRVVMVLVSLLAVERETGYFAASFRVFEFLVSLPLLLAGVGLPVISAAAGRDPERFHYVLRRMVEVGLLCGLLLALGVAVAAEPALVILGGEEYRPAAPVLRLQGLAIVGIFVSQAAIAGLVAVRAQRSVVVVSGSGIVSALVLGLILVPVMGAEGGALAVTIADTGLAVVALWLLRRRGVTGLLPAGFAARAALAAVAGVLPALVPGIPALAAAALGALLFVAVAHRLGIIPPEVLQALTRRRSAST